MAAVIGRIGGRLVYPSAVLALVGLVMLAVFGVGGSAIRNMLAQDARLTAELWRAATLGNDVADPKAAITQLEAQRLERMLDAAKIDAVVAIAPNGEASGLHSADAEAIAQLRQATGAAGEDLYRTPPGSFSVGQWSWLQPTAFGSWVLLPATSDAGARLAVRVWQSDLTAELVSTFQKRLVYTGSVAAITFFSFMAGFTYRARQLLAENEAIRFLALHDELTGLPNRKQFEEFLSQSLADCAEKGHKTALFILDLDGFKIVNDTLGHPIGDGLLRAAAKRLKGSIRSGDLLARLSGDEFAIVVPQLSQTSMLAPLADRVLNLLTAPFRVDGHEIVVGCSIGVAVAPENGLTSDALMRNADFALYRSKTEGKRTWRFFDPKMAEDLASRRTMEDGLRHAIHNGHFELLYQPRVDLASEQVIGFEAVLRWRLPGKGLIPASVFVPVAEESGLVIPIGEWAIRQAALACLAMPDGLRMSINMSAAQLKRDGVVEHLTGTLRECGVSPSRIEIEVNESILGRNEALAFDRLEKMRAAGIKVVMESFGVGALSLGLLSRYPFDKIKLHKSFLTDTMDEKKSSAVLAAICTLCRSLGMEVAGAGVETPEQAAILRLAGCKEAQGYLYAKPMTLADVVAGFGAAPAAGDAAAIQVPIAKVA